MIPAKITHGANAVQRKRRLHSHGNVSRYGDNFHCGPQATWLQNLTEWLKDDGWEEILEVPVTRKLRGITFGISKKEEKISDKVDLLSWGKIMVTADG